MRDADLASSPRPTRRLTPWLPAVFWTLVLYTLSAQSALPDPRRWGLIDLHLHFAVYTVLGVTLAWGGLRTRPRLPHWIPIGAGFLYAVLDELHQVYVPQRAPDVADALADWAGVIVGYGLTWALAALWRRTRSG